MEEVHFTEEYDIHGNLKITARLGPFSMQQVISIACVRGFASAGHAFAFVAHVRKKMTQQLRKCADDQLYWRGDFSVTLAPDTHTPQDLPQAAGTYTEYRTSYKTQWPEPQKYDYCAPELVNKWGYWDHSERQFAPRADREQDQPSREEMEVFYEWDQEEDGDAGQ